MRLARIGSELGGVEGSFSGGCLVGHSLWDTLRCDDGALFFLSVCFLFVFVSLSLSLFSLPWHRQGQKVGLSEFGGAP